MKESLLIALANGLVNNVVLARFLGLCSFMGVSNKVESRYRHCHGDDLRTDHFNLRWLALLST